MKVGFAQLEPVWGDKEANLSRIAAAVRGTGADLLVLPELCTTGYQLTREDAERLAEPFPGGPTADALAQLARAENVHLVVGVAERDGSRVFNSAVLMGPEGHLATYRKTHLFADEWDAFLPGDSGFTVHEVCGCKVGMMVCFDWLFPEAARTLALKGADLIAHPANLVLPFCQRTMPIRCLENGVFAVTANRVGVERRSPERPELRFTGASLIADPTGAVLCQAAVDGVGVQVVEIDPTRARQKMITPRNHRLLDRRPEHYLSDSARSD